MQSSRHGSNHSCPLSCSSSGPGSRGEREIGRESGKEREGGRDRDKEGRREREIGKQNTEGGRDFGKDRDREREKDKDKASHSQCNIVRPNQPFLQYQPQSFSQGQGQGPTHGQVQDPCFSPPGVEFIPEEDATCLLQHSCGDFTPISQHEGKIEVWTEWDGIE